MIKRLSYLCCGILGILSTFFAYATLGFKFVDGLPAASKDAYNAGLKANGGSTITFYEKIGDFRDVSAIKNSFDTVLASLLIVVALMCISMILVSAIISLIKKNNEIFKVMEIKWISIIGFCSLVIALGLGFLIERLPASQLPGVEKYTQNIGLGSITFLVATLASVVVSFVMKEESK